MVEALSIKAQSGSSEVAVQSLEQQDDQDDQGQREAAGPARAAVQVVHRVVLRFEFDGGRLARRIGRHERFLVRTHTHTHTR